tara:strand:- start:291 stop:599 length:309 start_codon:yes stop_codon:yes gene_type:complete
MKDFDVLCKSENVIVFKSQNCECINITLSNVNIHINNDGLMEMIHLMENKLCNIRDENKTVFVETPCPGMLLYFEALELRSLIDTLLSAKLKLELNSVKIKK